MTEQNQNEALVPVVEAPDVVGATAPVADDFLLAVAAKAEARIDAVIAIKRIAVKVTNGMDWCDQDGKPYMMVSAAEKIANLFNISWQINEPTVEEEPDGHYTYTYRGKFSLAGRSIESEGSRSSRDGFFKQYYRDEKGNRAGEKPVGERDNRRDVRMAAYTNLLGNGITRLLGMRNPTYADLEQFAGIKRSDIGKVDYKKHAPVKRAKETSAPADGAPADGAPVDGAPADRETESAKPEPKEGMAPNTFMVEVELGKVSTKSGSSARGTYMRFYAKGSDDEWYSTFDTKVGEAMQSLSGEKVSIIYKLEKTDKGENRSVISIGPVQ
jgi:hypothetical protein